MHTILVVDPDATFRGLLIEILEDDGYRVITAATGRQALAQVAATVPDLLICEYRLADMAGTALCAQLQADPATEAMRVLIFSDVRQADVIGQCHYHAFLRKPFHLPTLATVVAGLLVEDEAERSAG